MSHDSTGRGSAAGVSRELPSSDAAIECSKLVVRYGDRVALDELSLTILNNEIFGVLGPNGSGKTTLFRVLSTLMTQDSGDVCVLGSSLPADVQAVRSQTGVVFQSPALDKKLTVAENIHHQAALYGVPRSEWRPRTERLLRQFRLLDRANERTETLSGGLRRRAELAKGLVHEPKLLLLDEPSTGLDPGARIDLWQCLRELQSGGATIVLTTHLLEEADRCHRVAILNEGRRVALGTPDQLRGEVGGDAITLQTNEDPEALAKDINERFSLESRTVENQVRLECRDGHQWVPKIFEAFGARIQAIRLGKPTLEDVFVHHTGRSWE